MSVNLVRCVNAVRSFYFVSRRMNDVSVDTRTRFMYSVGLRWALLFFRTKLIFHPSIYSAFLTDFNVILAASVLCCWTYAETMQHLIVVGYIRRHCNYTCPWLRVIHRQSLLASAGAAGRIWKWNLKSIWLPFLRFLSICFLLFLSLSYPVRFKGYHPGSPKSRYVILDQFDAQKRVPMCAW